MRYQYNPIHNYIDVAVVTANGAKENYKATLHKGANRHKGVGEILKEVSEEAEIIEEEAISSDMTA